MAANAWIDKKVNEQLTEASKKINESSVEIKLEEATPVWKTVAKK